MTFIDLFVGKSCSSLRANSQKFLVKRQQNINLNLRRPRAMKSAICAAGAGEVISFGSSSYDRAVEPDEITAGMGNDVAFLLLVRKCTAYF